jgi:hypothetical protein
VYIVAYAFDPELMDSIPDPNYTQVILKISYNV